MTMQTSVLFVEKNLTINMWKIKKYCKDHCHYTGKYRGAAHSIYNFKYNVPKKSLQLFIIDQTLVIILS